MARYWNIGLGDAAKMLGAVNDVAELVANALVEIRQGRSCYRSLEQTLLAIRTLLDMLDPDHVEEHP